MKGEESYMALMLAKTESGEEYWEIEMDTFTPTGDKDSPVQGNHQELANGYDWELGRKLAKQLVEKYKPTDFEELSEENEWGTKHMNLTDEQCKDILKEYKDDIQA